MIRIRKETHFQEVRFAIEETMYSKDTSECKKQQEKQLMKMDGYTQEMLDAFYQAVLLESLIERKTSSNYLKVNILSQIRLKTN
jgi:hypothetical protein